MKKVVLAILAFGTAGAPAAMASISCPAVNVITATKTAQNAVTNECIRFYNCSKTTMYGFSAPGGWSGELKESDELPQTFVHARLYLYTYPQKQNHDGLLVSSGHSVDFVCTYAKEGSSSDTVDLSYHIDVDRLPDVNFKQWNEPDVHGQYVCEPNSHFPADCSVDLPPAS
jgi:hypothetical protein